MKLVIKFPNSDILEVEGYQESIQKLNEIQEEDSGVILNCEVVLTISSKTTGKPNFLIDYLKAHEDSFK